MSDHDAVNAANAAAAHAAGWPELTGSGKQIPWAISTRGEKIRELEAMDMPDSEETQWRQILLRETLADVWIDQRSNPWQAVAISNLTEEERIALFEKQTGVGATHDAEHR